MAKQQNKCLHLKPHNISSREWWYEEPKGIVMVHSCEGCDRTTVLKTITWQSIRAALARKDANKDAKVQLKGQEKTTMRKVYVEVKVKLVINANDGVALSKIIDEMEYEFSDNTGKADIYDSEILDYKVIDSK